MRQESKEVSRNSEKFEDGVLRADACMERYSISREDQFRTFQEDLPSFSFGRSAAWEERRLMRDAHRLIALGLKPLGSEPLEDFVDRHRGKLKEVI